MRRLHHVAAAVFLLLCAGCKSATNERPIGPAMPITAPLGLPPVPIPPDNPPTAATIALGRRLFFETRLSSDNTISCATCHNPALAFTDGRRVSLGIGNRTGVRNAPTLLNAAYSPLQFWDGRATTLEEQSADPLSTVFEMNQPHQVSVSKISKDPTYAPQFEQAFGQGPVTIGKIERALASFERTLLSGNSAFDRYEYGGDKAALSPSAIHGLSLFTDPLKGNCIVCHTINRYDALFTDERFHNTGAGITGSGDFTDQGRFSQTKSRLDNAAFKTPSLRNVALTAPYMHDGSLRTLSDVVDFYAGGGNSNPDLDPQIHSLPLNARDRQDLVEFLKSLTGDMPPDVTSLSK